MTQLTVKTLRHYHEIDLLAPAEIDPATNYRYYTRSQVKTAQVIRRFRNLEMPLDEVRNILAARDPAVRGKLIAAHLDRMERQLNEIRTAVASIQAILQSEPTAVAVEYRTLPSVSAATIRERVHIKNVTAWMTEALDELRRTLRLQGIEPVGPAGGLWPKELFSDEEGLATIFIPVDTPMQPMGRIKPRVVPGAELVVMVHHGSHADLDLTYGALGIHVEERELIVEGPVREYYVVDRSSTGDESEWVTEIAWPIFRASK